MVVGIIIANVLLVALLISVGLVIRDVRRLHHSSKSVADQPGDAAHLSPGGAIGMGGNVTHS
jgi:hypothetical protein